MTREQFDYSYRVWNDLNTEIERVVSQITDSSVCSWKYNKDKDRINVLLTNSRGNHSMTSFPLEYLFENNTDK